MTALKLGKDVDLTTLIAAVKHEALWIILAVALYFAAMRLTAKRDAAE